MSDADDQVAPDDLAARVDAQLRFAVEADRLKLVERRSYVSDGSRRENSAEHSWHLALMAIVLAEHTDEPIDVLRVLQMVLVHDLVEIDAGDAFVYDEDAQRAKPELEARAADRLFALLPDDQAVTLRATWEEFEARDTPEARFAAALDRLAPLVLNHASGGRSWREHGISERQVRAVNAHIGEGSAALWSAAQHLIADAVERGHLPADPGPESDS